MLPVRQGEAIALAREMRREYARLRMLQVRMTTVLVPGREAGCLANGKTRRRSRLCDVTSTSVITMKCRWSLALLDALCRTLKSIQRGYNQLPSRLPAARTCHICTRQTLPNTSPILAPAAVGLPQHHDLPSNLAKDPFSQHHSRPLPRRPAGPFLAGTVAYAQNHHQFCTARPCAAHL